MVYLPDKPEISTGKTPSLEVGTLTTGTGALVLELTLTLTLSGATMGDNKTNNYQEENK
jgi:hypothetical protein